MEIKQYAPVVIPTLNRYEHFKRCLESLEGCTGPEHTDVYVALDYPPSDKYVEGWKKMDAYLAEKEKDNGFKELIVYRRKENYFFSGKGNLKTAVDDLPQNVDRYIATEDDNEFSPCFLEYMNQNFEKYENDSSVFRICGYLPFRHKVDDSCYSQFKADRYIAWGVGIWKTKEKDYKSFYSQENVIKIAQDKHVREYYEKDRLECILTSLMKMSKGGSMLGDVVVTSYMEYRGLRCILPTKSMVRNHGWDGSGQHGGYAAGYKEQEICTNRDYEIIEAPEQFTLDFEKQMHLDRRNRKRTLNEIAAAVTWYLYKYTGLFCEFKLLHDWGKTIKNKLYGNK